MKKQKVEEPAAPLEKSLEIIDIDPAGDILLLLESKKACRVDSNAIKRASRKLYGECLSQRPANSSAWIFKGLDTLQEPAVVAVLNLIHANMDRIPVSMTCEKVYVSIVVAKKYEMLSRLSASLKQWYQSISQKCCTAPGHKKCKFSRLWATYHLGMKEECKDLQAWAIFNVCDNGKDALGDPVEQHYGRNLDLSHFYLSQKSITGKQLQYLKA
jgi:hypothetical protein